MNTISTSALLYEVSLLMDRIAQHRLQESLGISYSKFVFLFTVEKLGSASQHDIAMTLKISDPAVSKLCTEAVRDGMVHTSVNPSHKRKRSVQLTTAGRAILGQSIHLLDDCFSDICSGAGIDEASYNEQTGQLLISLETKYSQIKDAP